MPLQLEVGFNMEVARSIVAPSRQIRSRPPAISSIRKRTFVSNPFAGTNQTLTVTRTLPYPNRAVYKIIADVSQYSAFVPYCVESTVLRWSRPDEEGNKWPEEVRIAVGWGGLNETFISRMYCVPGRTIEALSGATKTTLPKDEIKHHGSQEPVASEDGQSTLLTHLLTRWTLRSFPYKPPKVHTTIDEQAEPSRSSQEEVPPQEQTEVGLAIEYQFANPVYNTMSAVAAPRVMERMIDAFEGRVASLVNGPGLGGTSLKVGKTQSAA